MNTPLLEIDNLHVKFARSEDEVHAVNGVSFTVHANETLGIVGESGSGKSVTLMSSIGLLRENGKITSGTAKFQGQDLLKLRPKQLEDIRGRDIGVIFQDPMTSLNPIMRIGDQIMEAMLAHQYCTRKEAYERTLQLMHEIGIPDPKTRMKNYPHEFSGGMRQRIMIAIALACEPQLLIADEPTTALDVTVQMQILALLQELRHRRGMSVVMVTHDFGVATNFCDKIIVMYGGQIMEAARTDDFIRQSVHPYSIGLKRSIIEVGHRGKAIVPIPGAAKAITESPCSCPFAPRCTFASERCHREMPMLRDFEKDHQIACHHAEEVVALAN
ncbi:ABC transporter ATP-binding protein [Paenibacillus sp. NFR01]|uniref:ABC transporter ATP-binding protein n=1 Tax=Paenibacillus sp. NFR01 TaxID=1566279 RepID=UPI0008B983F7|nr:ABC transporter ATP-binding protein [Paenibacillus sp. NFR01]SET86326.1 oligopeptide transport system ATP-binding protein [Paenibacillus sp. NFR01]